MIENTNQQQEKNNVLMDCLMFVMNASTIESYSNYRLG